VAQTWRQGDDPVKKLPDELEELIARRLKEGMSMLLITQRLGCNYKQVRKVVAKIKAKEEDGMDNETRVILTKIEAVRTIAKRIKVGMQTWEVQDLTAEMNKALDTVRQEFLAAVGEVDKSEVKAGKAGGK